MNRWGCGMSAAAEPPAGRTSLLLRKCLRPTLLPTRTYAATGPVSSAGLTHIRLLGNKKVVIPSHPICLILQHPGPGATLSATYLANACLLLRALFSLALYPSRRSDALRELQVENHASPVGINHVGETSETFALYWNGAS